MSKIPIDARERLNHILIETEYLKTVNQRINQVEDLENNEDLRRSTERSIEIIGEAVKTLPDSIKKLNPDIPWQAIAGMRNRVIHEYFKVNTEILWGVLTKNISQLNQTVKNILFHLNRQEYNQYKTRLQSKPFDQNYFLKCSQQETLDREIARTIINEYPHEFRSVALAKIDDILKVSDRFLDLQDSPVGITADQYLNKIKQSLFDSGEPKKEQGTR